MFTTFGQSSTRRITQARSAFSLFQMTKLVTTASCLFCDGQALSNLLESPSLHAIIKDLLLIVSAINGGLTHALVEVTVKVALTLEFVRSERLPAGAAHQKHRRKE